MENRLKVFARSIWNAMWRILGSDKLWLLVILSTVFIHRLPYSTYVVIDWDESVAATVAQRMIAGDVVYRDIWDHRGPLYYFALIPEIMLFGNSIIAFRLYATACVLASMLLVYIISARLFEGKVRLVPVLYYGLLFMDFGGLSSNVEVFMMLAVDAAALCFMLYAQKWRHMSLSLLLCGFFSAAAFFIKPTAIFMVALAPAYIAAKKMFVRDHSLKLLLNEISWYALGWTLVAIPLIGYFTLNNAVGDFYYAFYAFNNRYVYTISPYIAFYNWVYWLNRIKTWMVVDMAIIALMLLAIPRSYSRGQKHLGVMLAAFLMLSTMATFWGRNLYGHYLLQMGLSLSLLLGYAASVVNISPKDRDTLVVVAIMAVVLTSGLPEDVREFKTRAANMREEEAYMKVSNYIVNNTTENETILVVAGEPVAYFLTQRKAPIKYFFWIHHLSKWREILDTHMGEVGNPNIQNLTLTELYENKPAFIVFQNKTAENQSPEYLIKFMEENYRVEFYYKDGVFLYRRVGS